jgi:hypothetical protein
MALAARSALQYRPGASCPRFVFLHSFVGKNALTVIVESVSTDPDARPSTRTLDHVSSAATSPTADQLLFSLRMLFNADGRTQLQCPSNPSDLTDTERQEAEQRTSVKAHLVHEAIRIDGNAELERSTSALAVSGLAAGLSMGFSLISEGLLRSHPPDVRWRPLVAKFGYSFGFLIVIIGRQQLFTENTLTAVLPVLTKRTWTSLRPRGPRPDSDFRITTCAAAEWSRWKMRPATRQQ